MTKIRPGRLQEIENEDFSEFASLAYAKGFLLIYGKFLDVDVTPYLEAFETSESVTVDGYAYLQDNPAPKPSRSVAVATARRWRWRPRLVSPVRHWRRGPGHRVHDDEMGSRAPAPQTKFSPDGGASPTATASSERIIAPHALPVENGASPSPAAAVRRRSSQRHRPHLSSPPSHRFRNRRGLNRKCAGQSRCARRTHRAQSRAPRPRSESNCRRPTPRPPQVPNQRPVLTRHSAPVDLSISSAATSMSPS